MSDTPNLDALRIYTVAVSNLPDQCNDVLSRVAISALIEHDIVFSRQQRILNAVKAYPYLPQGLAKKIEELENEP